MKVRRLLSAICLAAVVFTGRATYAQPQANVEDHARIASEHFRRGRDAFLRRDFLAAGQAFDEAFASAPHHDALWNAAQSWESAGELARAANRYAAFLRLAPSSAPDRSAATASLGSLTRKLGRLRVYASAADQPRVDGEVVLAEVFYVYPGTHVVTIQRGRTTLDREVSVAAQEDKSVSFRGETPAVGPTEPPPGPAPAAPLRVTPAHEENRDSPRGARVLPPWTVILGGGLTLVGAGATTFFGVRSLDAKNDFDRSPSANLLNDGRDDQIRTNIALGTTIGLAAITTCVALLFVDWRGRAR